MLGPTARASACSTVPPLYSLDLLPMRSGLSRWFRTVGLQIACRSHGERDSQHSSARDSELPSFGSTDTRQNEIRQQFAQSKSC